MMFRQPFQFLLFSVTLIVLCFLSFCDFQKDMEEKEFFRNISDTVDYVGMATCKTCHFEVYETYIQTGMGKSFGLATKEKSSGKFGEEAIVFDTLKNFYYKPFWRNDSLLIQEYRIEKSDTIHKREEHVSFIIGSGQHTNSHLCNFNGFVHQAPITFYTQTQKWDLAPGFENGNNSRFDRIIGIECLTCHNGLPEFNHQSEN